MIKGFRFTNQLANAEVDARIHQEFLNKNDGIFYGMNLSKTNNSITISEGLCEIAGRPVAVINNETVAVSTESLYCLLILEIDLSKESTKDNFSQVSFKLLTSSTSYPTVTQQDINMYNGSNNLYQLEFARFKSGTSGITEFKDTRKFLNFNGIYAKIKADCEAVMNEIKQELESVKDGSAYLMKEKKEVLLDDDYSGLKVEIVKIGNLCKIMAYSKELISSSFTFTFKIPEWAQKKGDIINNQVNVEKFSGKESCEITGRSILIKNEKEGHIVVDDYANLNQSYYNELSYYID